MPFEMMLTLKDTEAEAITRAARESDLVLAHKLHEVVRSELSENMEQVGAWVEFERPTGPISNIYIVFPDELGDLIKDKALTVKCIPPYLVRAAVGSYIADLPD